MHFKPVLVFFSPAGQGASEPVRVFATENGMTLVCLTAVQEMVELVNRTFPACIVLDGADEKLCMDAIKALKEDTFSAIIPVVYLSAPDRPDAVVAALEAGADEVITGGMGDEEYRLRLQGMLNRADRDVSVHPSTRLPGTVQIERDMSERMRRGEYFAVCYADLDHFKEFNDRYGYNRGDQVILLLSRILRDVVKSYSPTGFIGHIGGDDFIFNVPLEAMETCCEEILAIFDELIPYQYSPEDRRAGYFLAKDRRGNIHRIPLMTLSIGVVTNRRREFTHTGRVSELATEMKSYAKTLRGSIFAVDRRSDEPEPVLAGPHDEIEKSKTKDE